MQAAVELHRRNRLLAVLRKSEINEFSSHCEIVELKAKTILLERNAPIDYVYFPHAGVVSLVATMRNGSIVEAASVGREGFVGIGAFLPDDTALTRHVVQMPGTASRIRLTTLKRRAAKGTTLRALLMAYTRAFVAQVLQSVACNAQHSIQQRYARWLLSAHDRMEGDTVRITQAYLATMLSVRRASIAVASQDLQVRGIISYGRGSTMILDREALEQASCECYQEIRRAFLRVLPHSYEPLAALED